MTGGSSSGMTMRDRGLIIQPVSCQFIEKSLMTQTQHFRRAPPVTVCLRHGIADHLNLESGDPVFQSLLLAGFLSRVGFRDRQMFFSNRFRQILYFDFAPAGQYDGTLDLVFEFTNVSRPMIGHQCLYGILRESLNFSSDFFRIFPQEVGRQERNIRSNLAQGGHSYMNDVEAEKKILPETTLFDLFLQVLIGRGNQPYIDRDRPAATHPFDFAFLKNTKQFCLSCRTEITDFVEKQRSTIGGFDPADAALDTGGNTFFDAEQFTFHQRLG